MKFKKCLPAACAFMAVSGMAQASSYTLEKNASITDQGYTVSELSGEGVLNFSNVLLTALNLASVKLSAVEPATVAYSTSTSSTGIVRYVNGSVSAKAPVTSITGTFDGTTVNVTGVQTSGGSLQSVTTSQATLGPGSLSISNLRVDLSRYTAGTTASIDIYADLSGGNGFASLSNYRLWTADTLTGPTTFTVNGAPQLFSATNTLSGIFLANATDIDSIFVKALNLNNTGRSGINSVNNRTLTNVDGFGKITSTISAFAQPVTAPVPEPGTLAMLGLGLAGIAAVGSARRRAVP
ncbi:PEP-CTERM sorting domain-containing protein [Aquabacterium sp.]|uniref:PEP-CTERM sorting domain-containing protein n=1 Tax=Aquabacterium sp. TaxID=1872578 RepID=UPI0024882D08|nr:PEP-CTERM sorting domain-containing protein [Aquabacterium sp.]MDI1348531.1 PEP-CTERM sorting domain-containing protein [Aquabacterium sp.]